ncbi:biopolymer transporter ExbD [candidate division KSB1 bacterium]|nr:biopolymer transporter ExbD [candidate division KSB1 bacterium]
MKLWNKRTHKVIINITSLIDVLFLLLIFFMVSSTFIEQPAMKLELPESKSAANERIKDVVLEVRTSDELYINGEKVNQDVLEKRLTEILPTLEEPTLILKADKTVPYGIVVGIMDVAKITGYEKIVIATQAPKN